MPVSNEWPPKQSNTQHIRSSNTLACTSLQHMQIFEHSANQHIETLIHSSLLKPITQSNIQRIQTSKHSNLQPCTPLNSQNIKIFKDSAIQNSQRFKHSNIQAVKTVKHSSIQNNSTRFTYTPNPTTHGNMKPPPPEMLPIIAHPHFRPATRSHPTALRPPSPAAAHRPAHSRPLPRARPANSSAVEAYKKAQAEKAAKDKTAKAKPPVRRSRGVDPKAHRRHGAESVSGAALTTSAR